MSDDFVEILYNIYQTSSVDKFNHVFRDEKESLLREGDKTGTTPNWPAARTINNLASATYARLKIAGEWDVPEDTKKKAEAYSAGAQTGTQPKQPSGSHSHPRGKAKCFNCGGDHLLPQCTKPRNEDEIAKNKAAYAKNHKHKPRHKKGKDG